MRQLIILFLLVNATSIAQYNYEPSAEFPFGKMNPEAPKQLKDFEPLIGLCNCKSESRNTDGTWSEPIDMTWKFKYIMNGMAIQDETLKADGRHSGSIRQFNTDSLKWYVHYYSTSGIPNALPSWEGSKIDNNIVLYRDNKAPNGTDGYYRLTFYDISKTGYKWIGEWVDKSETIIYPTWKIECKKTQY
jgi:hypothetical protein